MGDIVNNGTEEEFLWSCTLTNADKEYDWSPQDPADADDNEDDKEELVLGLTYLKLRIHA